MCSHDNVELEQTCRDNLVEEECSVVPKAGEWQATKDQGRARAGTELGFIAEVRD